MFTFAGDVKSPVDERINHGIGHSKEEDPDGIALLHGLNIRDKMADEDDFVWGPADDKRGHYDGSHA